MYTVSNNLIIFHTNGLPRLPVGAKAIMSSAKRKSVPGKHKQTTPEKRRRSGQLDTIATQTASVAVGQSNECEATTEQHALDDANISDDEEGGTRIGDIYIPPPIPPHCSTESKGPRLIIKKIENKNFKSYAGTVVLGPFHHVSKCVIGKYSVFFLIF